MTRIFITAVTYSFLGVSVVWGQLSAVSKTEFFEQNIRPVLIEKCYRCHNSIDQDAAGLALDSRDGIRADTEHGIVVVPGAPEKSLLLEVIRHEIDDLEMPEDAGRLDDRIIANFETWIRDGAWDPRDRPPTKSELARAISWDTTLANRKKWWSLQAVNAIAPPEVEGVAHPIDRFLAKRIGEMALPTAAIADRRTLVRRLYFVVTGLPPTPNQIRAFLDDQRPDAYGRLVDQLLQSQRFGERWARHWMDLMRYADSHGSEGDPAIPGIYHYRDYLIRAFNQDLPYDQLLREHVAGDLLGEPRINEALGINESQIGPAHWRLVFHGFAPTDALDEKVRFTDDQINVFSKAFLGLTVSCARCHDHKFDAISQADYYGLFGILASCRPAIRDVSLEEKQSLHAGELARLKDEIRQTVATHWLGRIARLSSRLTNPDELFSQKLENSKSANQLLFHLAEVSRRQQAGESVESVWRELKSNWIRYRDSVAADAKVNDVRHWDMSQDADYQNWFSDGQGLPAASMPAGTFRVDLADNIIAEILPSGVHANVISTKHRSFLASPRFKLEQPVKVWLRLTGGGQAMSRYAVENYPRDGTVYPIREIDRDQWFWQEYDLSYWSGDSVHLEINTARDAPLRIRNSDRSWFGIREVVVRPANSAPPIDRNQEFAELLFDGPTPKTREDTVAIYVAAVRSAILAWKSETLTDAQAILLNECLRVGLLDNSGSAMDSAGDLAASYRKLEDNIPLPIRVPGLMEADAFDQPLYIRGNHKQPAAAIPRRFLEAISATPYETEQSGRLELAADLVDPANPLVARVMVNRIWQYVFGQGIVQTPDNFGQLGKRPSHPELLDYLAEEFSRDWSIKKAIRLMVSSQAFQRASQASPDALRRDPENQFLSHANVRRLDAESIRDSLMLVAGSLDLQMYGPGFAANSKVPRRAVYVASRRNALDRFLEAFNAPLPFSTTGRRSETNVPSQSLAMLNSPFVQSAASQWAERMLEVAPGNRSFRMFEAALGRPPTEAEIEAVSTYVQQLAEQSQSRQKESRDLQTRLEKCEKQLSQCLDPVRHKLRAGFGDGENSKLDPVAAWDFESGLSDSVGYLDGIAQGDASVVGGELVLNGGFVATPPIDRKIAEKTLVATVRMDDLEQRGGGLMSLQTRDGREFDAIVFGEREPQRWMSGSDNFRRTKDFGGESELVGGQVRHLAIAYDTDGTIRCYRDGNPYGQPIRKGELKEYSKGNSQVLFGLRHGDGGNGRILRGAILDAQLFDRALTAEEVKSLAMGQAYIADEELLRALTDLERRKVLRLRAIKAGLHFELAGVEPELDELGRWTRLTHALFNLKEFIYLQ